VTPRLTPLAALAAVLLLAAPAAASRTQEATFQDDNRLVYSEPSAVAATLDELRSLGVDRLRITMVWRNIAPANSSERKPAGFDATDPGDYPRGAWDRWDTVLRLARERGMDVNFNISTPAPDWATGTPVRPDLKDTWDPNAAEFGNFVRAAARRYDGRDGRPRVSYWSIQNEPNQAGWLTPQWVQDGSGTWVEAAPRIYRGMVAAAWQALQETGHGDSTILIGETAPKGLRHNRGETRSIDALRFIRRLYCLDDNLQVLRGSAAEAQGCPTADQVAAFPAANPGLFRASGFAHHPYEMVFAPDRRPPWRDWATMANLGDLQTLLRRAHQRYAQPLRGNVPLYLTEFGYQTNPPDRFGVTSGVHARYINHAEYIAWRNAAVRTHGQFLLVDDGEPISRTFQSGLRWIDGRAKPAYAAYRFPIHLPRRTFRRGQQMTVWGIPRAAPPRSRPSVQIQFRRAGTKRWRRIATRRGDATRGYLNVRLRAPGTGAVRLAWNGQTSRAVPIRVTRARARR
jgi:hypothetical protein